jgi:hypothetical protein
MKNGGIMGIFGKIVSTAINVATLPLAVAKDVVTLGNVGNGRPFTEQKLDQIKDEAK